MFTRHFLFFSFSLFSFPLFSAPFIIEESDPLLYPLELLSVIDKDKGGVKVSAVGDELNLRFRSGFGISRTERFIRLDLSNAKFSQTFSLVGLKFDANYESSIVSGGAAGDSYVIFSVKANNSLGPETEFELESNSFIWIDYKESLNVKYRLFDSPTAAIYEGDHLFSYSASIAKSVLGIGNSVSRSFSHYVEFSQNFIRFKETYRAPSTFNIGDAKVDLASLGKIQFDKLIAQPIRDPITSALITSFSELLPEFNLKAKTATISGDFSSIKAYLNDQDDCLGTSFILAEYSTVKEVKVSINDLIAHPVFCVAVESNIIPIKRSAYFVDLGIGIKTSLLGQINYDAASIDLPYITSFQNYRQRIYLVNHAGYDVTYTTHFIGEPGLLAEFSEGVAASGIIPAGVTLKLTSQDLVKIESDNLNRISARIFFDTKAKDISAAVQILSLSSSEPPVTNVLKVREN